MSGRARIRRGHFAGDNYTHLHNGVFRGGHLNCEGIAVLGHMASHIDGWETTQKDIARSMQITVYKVAKGMESLQAQGYMIQGQEQVAAGVSQGGQFGAAWYYVTDRPAELWQRGTTDLEVVRGHVYDDLEQWLHDHEEPLPKWLTARHQGALAIAPS